jgi:hypothetical protein
MGEKYQKVFLFLLEEKRKKRRLQRNSGAN